MKAIWLFSLKEEISWSISQNQVFMKRMFVLKESKDRFKRKVWVFWSEHSRKWEIYFVFCGIEHLHHMVCSVIEINICSEDLQEVVIDKKLKKTLLQLTKDILRETTIFFRSSHQRCSMKKLFLKFFCNILRKTPVLEFLFKKITGLQACNY